MTTETRASRPGWLLVWLEAHVHRNQARRGLNFLAAPEGGAPTFVIACPDVVRKGTGEIR